MRADPKKITTQTDEIRQAANNAPDTTQGTGVLLFAIYARLGDVILEIGALSDLIETPGIKDELLARQRKLKEDTHGRT